MNPSEKDYARVGRRLDGEDVELTAAQRALAREVAADAEKVGLLLDVKLPPGLLHRLHGRMVDAGRTRLRGRWLRRAGAAAAAVVIAGAVFTLIRTRGGNGISPQQYVETFLRLPAEELDARVELLAEEVADYRMQLCLGEACPLEMALQGLEEEMGQFDPGGFEGDGVGPDDDAKELLW